MYGRSAQGPDGGQPCVCHPRRALLCRIQKTTDHDRPPLPALLAHTPAQCSSPPSRRQEVHHAHGHHPRPSRWRHAYYGEFRMDGRAAALVCVLPMLAPCPCWPRAHAGPVPMLAPGASRCLAWIYCAMRRYARLWLPSARAAVVGSAAQRGRRQGIRPHGTTPRRKSVLPVACFPYIFCHSPLSTAPLKTTRRARRNFTLCMLLLIPTLISALADVHALARSIPAVRPECPSLPPPLAGSASPPSTHRSRISRRLRFQSSES